jgi:hypothetical protein
MLQRSRAVIVLGLVEEPNDLTCNVLSSRLLVVHNTGGCGEDDVAELTRWQELDDPLLHVNELNVIAGADDACLVDTERSSVYALRFWL